jgi:hypothetical protein
VRGIVDHFKGIEADPSDEISFSLFCLKNPSCDLWLET